MSIRAERIRLEGEILRNGQGLDGLREWLNNEQVQAGESEKVRALRSEICSRESRLFFYKQRLSELPTEEDDIGKLDF